MLANMANNDDQLSDHDAANETLDLRAFAGNMLTSKTASFVAGLFTESRDCSCLPASQKLFISMALSMMQLAFGYPF